MECDLGCPSRRREDNESGSRPTDRPDTPATPFTQPAEGETSIRGPYVLWIICFSKTTAGEIQLPLVMLPQFSLMLETAHQNNSGRKLEAVFFVCFPPQFPSLPLMLCARSAFARRFDKKKNHSLFKISIIIIFVDLYLFSLC